ncbi:MAG: FliM/FliN family flagellar motor switch protein [Rhodobacteraceae bacterium]|jgi:flagellar motor switch protein FliM|nr:FliM/FliN family flagellar motor switch protein [Paracoccaceae bacterium]
MAAHAVLRRKAGAVQGLPRAAHEAERALPLALARAAQDGIGLALTVERLEARRASLTELLELPPAGALLAIVEGPGESLGLVALAPEVLAAVIERQAIGRVTAAAPATRRPTRTDAAMTAPLVDRFLAEFAAGLGPSPDAAWASGYRYASFLDDPRPLGLLLEDAGYRLFLAEVALGSPALKRGEVLIAMPAVPRAPTTPRRRDAPAPAAEGVPAETAAPRDRAAEDAAAAAAAAWARSLESVVLGAPAVLDAVLDRISLPIAAVLGLRPGSVLPLPSASIERLALEGPGGRRLAEGRLGQARGLRAIRVVPPEAAATAPPA